MAVASLRFQARSHGQRGKNSVGGFPSGDTVGSCARTGCASEVRPSHSRPARPKETATSSSAARRSADEHSELDVTNVSRQNSSPQILCGRNVRAHVFVDTLKPPPLLKRSQLCGFNLKRAPRFPNLSFVRLLCQANFHRRNGVTAKSIARNASNTFLVGRFVAGQFRLITSGTTDASRFETWRQSLEIYEASSENRQFNRPANFKRQLVIVLFFQ